MQTNSLGRIFKKDSIYFGILISILTSVILYSVFILAAGFFPEAFSIRVLRKESLALISIFVNLLTFRYYMINLKLEKTGKGILLAVFVLMIMFFVLIHNGSFSG
jgi:uncharacterized membrane protein YozB (DUF420 family)